MMVESRCSPPTCRPAWRDSSTSWAAAAAMSAIGLPSNSSEVAMRAMSLTERAPRKASRKLSEDLFSERNSRSFVTSRVHEKIEHSRRPIMTTLTTGSASRNIWIGVRRPAFLIWVGAASLPPLLTAPEAAAGAAASEDAAAGAAGACANAGAPAISARAPTRAAIELVLLISSIFRQFLVGLAPVWLGSSRTSVSTLLTLKPGARKGALDPLTLRSTPVASCLAADLRLPRASVDLPVGAKSHRQKNLRLGTFDNPVTQRQGATRAIMHSCAYWPDTAIVHRTTSLAAGRNNHSLMTLFYAATQHFCARLPIIVQVRATRDLCTIGPPALLSPHAA